MPGVEGDKVFTGRQAGFMVDGMEAKGRWTAAWRSCASGFVGADAEFCGGL